LLQSYQPRIFYFCLWPTSIAAFRKAPIRLYCPPSLLPLSPLATESTKPLSTWRIKQTTSSPVSRPMSLSCEKRLYGHFCFPFDIFEKLIDDRFLASHQITHESVMRGRKLRIVVGFAKNLLISAVFLGTEMDWDTHRLLSRVKIDMHSSSSKEYITTLDYPNRSCNGRVITLAKLTS